VVVIEVVKEVEMSLDLPWKPFVGQITFLHLQMIQENRILSLLRLKILEGPRII
jgi:hypothetical protein